MLYEVITDLSAWGMELTPEVAEALPDMIRMVIEEIEKAGGMISAY